MANNSKMRVLLDSIQSAGKHLLRAIVNNWPLKLLSLLLAVFLWGGLITQDETLTREKVFTDVSINITNSDTLRRNGYIVTGGLDSLPSARIRAEVPQKVFSTASASAYNVRVDLSRVSEAGMQTLPVVATNSSTYGSVLEISPSSVELTIEEYITRTRIPVTVSVEGTYTEPGLTAGEVSYDPRTVTIAGPRSVTLTVSRCVALYDQTAVHPQAEGTVRTAVPFRLENASGELIDSSLITVTYNSVTIDSVIVEQSFSTTVAE